LTAQVSSKHRHNYPAPIAALRAIFNGTTVKSMDQALRVETREFSALTRDPVARNIIRTLFIHRGERARLDDAAKKEAKAAQAAIAQQCRSAYREEGRKMLEQGTPAALVANAALVAGMDVSPLEEDEYQADINTENFADVDLHQMGQRLLCVQALVAAEAWVRDELEPVDADLGSVLNAGFPSYTGGVMSYVDTMGLGAFMTLCSNLAPSEELRKRAVEQDRVYLPVA
jgi:3-hydroxyacyl-CoA dehydrogenase/enoyl-CoA hydratase/3-hydroxybutyryl-CoA epimerase